MFRFWTPLTERAIRTAAYHHRHQLRKGDGVTPYITHLFAVALIVAGYTDDEEIIAAALLHDTLEDTSYTAEQLTADFGPRVCQLVQGVTENKATRDWVKRKQNYLQNLCTAPADSQLIAAADKIHNVQSLQNDHATIGERLWRKFTVHNNDPMWFYRQVATQLPQTLKHPIVAEYLAVLQSAERQFAADKKE